MALGENRSAALLTLAAERVGLQARLRPPHEIGLRADGDRHDASPVEVDAARLAADLAVADLVVVPGFVAQGPGGETVLLGRGGTDLSAVFLAAQLGARVRLLKDVDGVYDRDPAVNRAGARQFARISWDEAERLAHPLVQDKAVRLAGAHGVEIEVAALGAAYETVIGPDTALRVVASAPVAPLRVALLGCGVVGGGVLERLLGDPDRFEVASVLVRDVGRRASHRAARLFTDDAEAFAEVEADVFVDAGCGLEPSSRLIEAYLARGVHVVSANKQAVNAGRARFAAARAGDARLLHSAAVGGGAPFLEAAERCRSAGVVLVEGVVNGTTNYVLGRLAEGLDLAAAVAAAQRAGFAEADPSSDLEGRDAAAKLELLAAAVRPDRAFTLAGLDVLAAESLAAVDGQRIKQVARARLGEDGWIGEVRLEALDAADFLAGAEAEENRLRLTLADGRRVCVAGKGAGCWPTAESVLADLLELSRGSVWRGEAARAPVAAVG